MANLFYFQQFTIDQSHAAMKLGTDSDLLGTLAEIPKPTPLNPNPSILDIGTGTGILALMMAQRFPEANVTAIDIDENAIIDARENFKNSPFAARLTLHHISLQEFSSLKLFDAIVCNPPYFDKSLEAGNLSRTRARHTSSLPFRDLIECAFKLLRDDGVFSVCIPPEVLPTFTAEALICGFRLKENYQIKSVPDKPAKRFILVYKKGHAECTDHTFCMRNEDRSYTTWYNKLMKDFLKPKRPTC